MGYEWDLFVSYPRRAPIGLWVCDRLLPVLKLWLGAAMPVAPKIFVDQDEIPNGAHWPSHLADALLKSKYMLAVLAPPYFGSGWCISEGNSMKEREARLGLGHGGARGLMRVIRYFDGASFPPYAQSIQTDDYTAYNRFPNGKREPKSKLYNEFVAAVQTLSLDLAAQIADSPQWDPTWPVLASPDPNFSASLIFNNIALTGVIT